MRRTFTLATLVLGLALTAPIPAHAGTLFDVEPQLYVLDPGGDGQLLLREAELLVLHDVTSRFGLYSFALVNEAWGQVQAGPTYWLVPGGVQVGLGAALEQHATPYRGAAFLYLDPSLLRGFQVLAVGERGGSGSYYTVHGGYKVTDWLRLGAMGERFAGVGPRVDVYPISKTPIRVWAMAGHDFEADSNTVIVSVAYDCVFGPACE
ncbi:MAG: hypothetical protein Q7R80_02295 [bacterium]|nr:hypothetical protein [bacterium]